MCSTPFLKTYDIIGRGISFFTAMAGIGYCETEETQNVIKQKA